MDVDRTRAPHNLVTVRDAKPHAEGVITHAYAQGLIDDDELERRLEALQDAETADAVERLIADLVDHVDTTALAVPTTIALANAQDVAPTRSIVAMFASIEQQGAWVPAQTNRLLGVFAEAELDFRNAHLAPGETRIELRCIFAEARIIVPPNLAVRVDASVIMGAVERDDTVPASPSGPNAPILVITGLVLFASVEIRERLPGEGKRDARRRRRATRRAARRARRAAKRQRKQARKLRRAHPNQRQLE
ncbi:hypothetical protein DB30_03042 [Enhygromyxa salina]|uniref:Cell wall-active antibiotics response LiaF-like C-terminal domain-containing protein n=1 Tax=Enhygromyxa salina TaxID=215803 RepID=A0A0C2D2S3_9BACT|nr:LiaF domain-containing protein [Enhygromyxa salina]KIG17561.1 hypothetical protein DB30_03042 [Enhygromyxa salina]